MTSTIPLDGAKLIGEAIGWILFFPVWWYTRGLVSVLEGSGQSIKNKYTNLGLGVWLTNLFVPMYGTTDITGRIISFFVRLVVVIVRGIALLLWLVLVLLFLLAYLLFLPFSVFGFAYHLFF
ncbi:MAG: hypothetical protein WC702_04640 [Patescibacteria group bacterium]|jgi:hypothetical protein